MGHGGGVLGGIGLPIVLIAVAAIGLPFLMTPRRVRSQRRLLLAVLWSALGLYLLGAALFGVLYQMGGSPILYALFHESGQVLGFLLPRAALTALIWGPLLGLAWLSLSRRLERIRAEEGMFEDMEEDGPEPDLDWDEEGARDDLPSDGPALDALKGEGAAGPSGAEGVSTGDAADVEDFIAEVPFRHRPGGQA